jgi:hypothetical protein
VRGVADGVIQGASSVVSGVFKGIRGVVQKPLDGATRSGATGFMKGLGQGIAGAAAMPVAGVLDLGASTFQGVNASLTTAIHGRDACMMQRTRLQRSVAPSGAVGPWNLERALGHALLVLTNLKPESHKTALFRSSGLRHCPKKHGEQQLDCYFLLPAFLVAMLTGHDIMLVKSEEFVRVHHLAMSTGTVNVAELSAGASILFWSWLCPELCFEPFCSSHFAHRVHPCMMRWDEVDFVSAAMLGRKKVSQYPSRCCCLCWWHCGPRHIWQCLCSSSE